MVDDPVEGRMILGAWRRSWLAYDFDRDSGRFTRRLVKVGEHVPLAGFAALEKTREHGRVFFALYRFAGRIHFQAGPRRFTLDAPDLRFEYHLEEGGASSRFAVYEAGACTFSCSYRHRLRALLARLHLRGKDEGEPDDIDREGRHFLAHVAGQRLPLLDSEVWEDGEALVRAPAPTELRKELLAHVALLAAPEQQRDYERRVKIADVPAELVCGFLDDVYVPESPAFHQAFTPPERERLRAFADVLNEAAAALGDVHTVSDLQMRPQWTRVVEEAEQVLRVLEATPAPPRASGA